MWPRARLSACKVALSQTPCTTTSASTSAAETACLPLVLIANIPQIAVCGIFFPNSETTAFSFFWGRVFGASCFPSLVLVPFLLACSLACRPCCDAPLLLLLFFSPLICSHLFRCLCVLLLLILFMTSYFCLLFFDAGFALPRTCSTCQLWEFLFLLVY